MPIFCAVDFALIPGSTSNVVNRILWTIDIPDAHKQAILAAKSRGMNTSCGIGEIFSAQVEKRATLAEAVKSEIDEVKQIYESPIEAQGKLMDVLGNQSFDVRKCMSL